MPNNKAIPQAKRETTCPDANPVEFSPILRVENLGVTIGRTTILEKISLEVSPYTVFGLVGSSGAGKSTLLRCLNRMIEMTPGVRIDGSIHFHGRETLNGAVDGDALRARIGMIFQQPVVFPTSIEGNVLFGVRRLRRLSRSDSAGLVEQSLREASLWEEVKNRLRKPAQTLSIGQQQRLCLSRTLATDPEVILMDEPTSALDARSTEAIESLILRMKEKRTIVLVTHNLGQARRVTDWVACLCPSASTGAGELLESACCDSFFDSDTCRLVFQTLADDRTFA
ncbi:MAG: phosphate ABC transporter ATP-binding protein [Verrucomicrobiales bacterium]